MSEETKWAVEWKDGLGHVRWQPQRPDGQRLWVGRLWVDGREWDANERFFAYAQPLLYRSQRRAARIAMEAERRAMKAHNARFRQV